MFEKMKQGLREKAVTQEAERARLLEEFEVAISELEAAKAELVEVREKIQTSAEFRRQKLERLCAEAETLIAEHENKDE